MSDFLFSAPPVSALPVRGKTERIPIRRIFCVGRNYEAHAKEMGGVADREAPFYFTKSSEHYVPSGATIAFPLGTMNCHYEMELVAVLGAMAFRVPVERALDAVYGYACGLDLTRRDLQFAAREQKRPWDLGKDFEQSAVISEVMPAAEIGHPKSGSIELRLNGETKQNSDISQLIHGVPEIIAHLSNYYHLNAGDVIFTGTPEGVGPISPGDVLEGSVAGVGTISLHIATRGASFAARLEAGAKALLAEVGTLPAELIGWKPADDVWSVMEILGHVSEFVPYWTGQATQIARHPQEQWGRTHADTARVDAVNRARARSLADVTSEIRAGVDAAAATLRGLSGADLAVEAMSRNPRWGLKPASFVVDHLVVEHVEKHLGQIRRNAAQFRERAGGHQDRA
jgi:fumarylpyruvate hydrolase